MARAQEIPAYLQSEEAFKNVASYSQRKALVQGNERRYGISERYTGQTHQNIALMRFLQDNPKAREQFEQQIGITRESLSQLRQEYESTKRKGFFGRLFSRDGQQTSFKEASSKGNFFKKETRSTAEINEQGTRAFDASEKERMFMDINNEMVKAWRKDIGSHLITGGLLGLLESRTSNLNKALRSIEGKYSGYSSKITSQLQSYFANLNELTRAYGANPASRAGKEILMGFLTPIGFEREKTLQRIQSDPGFTGRLGAFLQVAIGFAISSAMGSPSIYLGSLNTGIKMKDVRNPNKDTLSQALFNSSYNTIVSDNDREHGRYNRMLGDNGVRAETRDRLTSYRASLSGNVGEYEEAADEGFKATGGYWLFRTLREVFTKTEREVITGNYPLSEKFAAIDKAIAELGDKKQTDNVRTQIAQLQRLKSLYGRRAQMQEHDERSSLGARYDEAFRVMNRFEDFDQIKDFLMPSNTKKWMKIYLEGGSGYAPRDKNLLKYLWDSNDTPGFQRFIKSVSSGNMREYNNWVLQQEGASAQGRKTEKYGRDISAITTGPELSTYLNSTEPGQGRLASIYAAQVNNLGRNIHVDPEEIVRAARYAQRAQEGLLNTGRNSNNIDRLKKYTGGGFYFDVPATYTGNGHIEKVLIRIGVKPNCSNLQIGDIVGRRFYDASNLSSNLNFRIPLMLQIPRGGGGGGKGGDNPGGGGNGGNGPKSSGDSYISTSGEQPVPSPTQVPGISGNYSPAEPLVQQATTYAPGVVILPSNPAGI